MLKSQRLIGLYPGTFDPITRGHTDIIERAITVVDHLIIGVATSPQKRPLFNLPERVAMVQEEMTKFENQENVASISVLSFDNLLMHFAVSVGAKVIVRGLRAVSDFEYEFQMAGMNMRLNSAIETIFFMASDRYQFISSSMVKEVGRLGGDISQFVSPHVAKSIVRKYNA